MLANDVIIQNPYAKIFVVHIVSFLPHLSAITPPRVVPGIVATANSVAEIELHGIAQVIFCDVDQFTISLSL